MKLLDTTFLIDLIRGRNGINDIVNSLEGMQATTTINVHEFLVGGYGSRTSQKELKIRRSLLDGLIILPLNFAAADRSAQIEAELKKEGTMVGTADTLIAGIMIEHGIRDILTRNTKHFKLITEINVIDY